jgi:hypothetical protein
VLATGAMPEERTQQLLCLDIILRREHFSQVTNRGDKEGEYLIAYFGSEVVWHANEFNCLRNPIEYSTHLLFFFQYT